MRCAFSSIRSKVLSTCFLRPGSEVYASENKSYGIATLRKRHVRVAGDVVEFGFEGKSGKQQERALRDRAVARVVRRSLELPGLEVGVRLGDALLDPRQRLFAVELEARHLLAGLDP